MLDAVILPGRPYERFHMIQIAFQRSTPGCCKTICRSWVRPLRTWRRRCYSASSSCARVRSSTVRCLHQFLEIIERECSLTARALTIPSRMRSCTSVEIGARLPERLILSWLSDFERSASFVKVLFAECFASHRTSWL